jgi:hypothetical protein
VFNATAANVKYAGRLHDPNALTRKTSFEKKVCWGSGSSGAGMMVYRSGKIKLWYA